MDNFSTEPEKVTDIPPGVTNLLLSPDGNSVLGLEEATVWVSEDYYKYHHPWVFSLQTGTWTDLGPVVRPFADARWLDGRRLIVRRQEGLAVIDVSSGETAGNPKDPKKGLPCSNLFARIPGPKYCRDPFQTSYPAPRRCCLRPTGGLL